jgi:hypothetical protein
MGDVYLAKHAGAVGWAALKVIAAPSVPARRS